jgi:hypothetical protein
MSCISYINNSLIETNMPVQCELNVDQISFEVFLPKRGVAKVVIWKGTIYTQQEVSGR